MRDKRGVIVPLRSGEALGCMLLLSVLGMDPRSGIEMFRTLDRPLLKSLVGLCGRDGDGDEQLCHALQLYAMQCNAMQCSGVQCSGVECSGVEWSAVQCSGVEWSGVQCSAIHYRAAL